MSSPSSRRSLRIDLGTGELDPLPPADWLFARLARAALKHVCTEPGEGRDLCGRIVDYWAPMVDVHGQYTGVRSSAASVCSDFASPPVARTLYFGCEPGYRAARKGGSDLDFARLVAPDGPGTLVLVQPARDGQDTLVAVALKAVFFEAVLDDPDRARGGADLPLVGYIADEFHRFVTSDPLHGEQSFLDTCRSFGAACVLACQSVASINHALARGGGSYDQNAAAVEIVWSNTGSKIVFRSTDPEVAHRVSGLSPHRPGLPGVVRVRPVSTLGPGECYAALSDGRFERRQLGQYRAEEPHRGRGAGRGPGASGRGRRASRPRASVSPRRFRLRPWIRPSPPGANREPRFAGAVRRPVRGAPRAVRVTRSPPGPRLGPDAFHRPRFTRSRLWRRPRGDEHAACRPRRPSTGRLPCAHPPSLAHRGREGRARAARRRSYARALARDRSSSSRGRPRRARHAGRHRLRRPGALLARGRRRARVRRDLRGRRGRRPRARPGRARPARGGDREREAVRSTCATS